MTIKLQFTEIIASLKDFCAHNKCKHAVGEKCNYDDALFVWTGNDATEKQKSMIAAMWMDRFIAKREMCFKKCENCTQCNTVYDVLEQAIKVMDLEGICTALFSVVCNNCELQPSTCKMMRMSKSEIPNNFVPDLTRKQFNEALGVDLKLTTRGHSEEYVKIEKIRIKTAYMTVKRMDGMWMPNHLKLLFLDRYRTVPKELFLDQTNRWTVLDPLKEAAKKVHASWFRGLIERRLTKHLNELVAEHYPDSKEWPEAITEMYDVCLDLELNSIAFEFEASIKNRSFLDMFSEGFCESETIY